MYGMYGVYGMCGMYVCMYAYGITMGIPLDLMGLKWSQIGI